MKKRCIYCHKEKNQSEFSKEHILPSSLTGSLTNNPFITYNACQRCNNLAGMFIDGPFTKGWFNNMGKSGHFKRFCDPNKTDIVPLTYMGQHRDLKYINKVCDDWFGPTGDVIYHFHDPYPEESGVPPMIGVPSTAWNKEIDKGFVFLFIKSNNPVWHKTIILSVLEQFKGAPIFLGNGERQEGSYFDAIPEELKTLHRQLLDSVNGEQNVGFQISIHNDDVRFLCKLALGLCDLNLNPSFFETQQAEYLRSYLWERSPQKRNKIKLHGTVPPKENGLDTMLKWEHGHCIALTNTSGITGLYANFFGGNGYSLMLSDNIEHWEPMKDGGLVYIVVPALGKVVGPISFTKYVLHMNLNEDGVIVPELNKLKKELDSFKKVPIMI